MLLEQLFNEALKSALSIFFANTFPFMPTPVPGKQGLPDILTSTRMCAEVLFFSVIHHLGYLTQYET